MLANPVALVLSKLDNKPQTNDRSFFGDFYDFDEAMHRGRSRPYVGMGRCGSNR
jgi:hypothetical protein